MRAGHDIICLGGAHLDIIGRADGPVHSDDSTPGRMTTQPGGVARNVAALMAGFGHKTALISHLGDDDNGNRLLAQCKKDGIETRFLTRKEAQNTASYLAIEDVDGRLITAIAAMAIYETFLPSQIMSHVDHLRAARLLLADTNCPTETIEALAYLRDRPYLAVDTVSIAKAPRLRNSLDRIDCLFCNRQEAYALLGRAVPLSDTTDATTIDTSLARALEAEGCRRAVITNGPDPILCLDQGHLETCPVPAVTTVSVTGAGDALIAGVLHYLLRGHSLIDSVGFGQEIAQRALQQSGNLTPDQLG